MESEMADIFEMDIGLCPFCGCGAPNVCDTHSRPFVRCGNCGAEVPHYKSVRAAIAAWNRCDGRAYPKPLASEDAVMRSLFAPVTPDVRGPIKVNVLLAGVDRKGEYGIDLYVDPETAARIVTAKGLRLLLVEGGE